MKLAILSRSSGIYSTKRLYEAAVSRGHQAHVVDHLGCYIGLSGGNAEIHYQEQILQDFDAVIPRIGASNTFYGTAVLRQFEAQGVHALNSSSAILEARDKLHAHQVFARNGIPMPITGFAHSTKRTHDLISMVGGAPLIVKLLYGTQGNGVILAETNKAAESLINAFRGLDAYFLVQQFVAEAGNADIRCIVLGNNVIASMQRKAKEGEYRANLHLGGHAELINITEEEREVAIKAAQALGIRCGGVDLIRSNHGPLVLEVNSSPGLGGIEKVTKMDIASKIIEFMENEME